MRIDAQALCMSCVLLMRLHRAPPASSHIFAPSTVGQGGRGQASVGDDAAHRDTVAQQVQRVGANAVTKVEAGGRAVSKISHEMLAALEIRITGEKDAHISPVFWLLFAPLPRAVRLLLLELLAAGDPESESESTRMIWFVLGCTWLSLKPWLWPKDYRRRAICKYKPAQMMDPGHHRLGRPNQGSSSTKRECDSRFSEPRICISFPEDASALMLIHLEPYRSNSSNQHIQVLLLVFRFRSSRTHAQRWQVPRMQLGPTVSASCDSTRLTHTHARPSTRFLHAYRPSTLNAPRNAQIVYSEDRFRRRPTIGFTQGPSQDRHCASRCHPWSIDNLQPDIPFPQRRCHPSGNAQWSSLSNPEPTDFLRAGSEHTQRSQNFGAQVGCWPQFTLPLRRVWTWTVHPRREAPLFPALACEIRDPSPPPEKGIPILGRDPSFPTQPASSDLTWKAPFRHPCLRHGRSDTVNSQFRADTVDSEPSGATRPLANARSAWRLGVHGRSLTLAAHGALGYTVNSEPWDKHVRSFLLVLGRRAESFGVEVAEMAHRWGCQMQCGEAWSRSQKQEFRPHALIGREAWQAATMPYIKLYDYVVS
ncbi:hypothetical protein B0H14DRAFT_2562581 [Mycena olivaceomarginata]|nr:hypothetical protein B0H14DRAFT_2562581 [Mycena olivaceomarginata]